MGGRKKRRSGWKWAGWVGWAWVLLALAATPYDKLQISGRILNQLPRF